MPAWICPKCGCKVPHIKIFPIRCACGHVETQETFYKTSILDQSYTFLTLAKERKVACVCCSAHHGDRCDKIDAGCRSAFINFLNNPKSKCPRDRWDQKEIEFISYEHLAQVTRGILGQFLSDTSIVVGIPRSGMLPASIIATSAHLPLYSLREGKLQYVGGGYRSPLESNHIKKILLVDDSISTGFCMTRCLENIRKEIDCDITTAAIFVSPDTSFVPDIIGQWLQSPHWFEWNLLNAITATLTAVDMDGVLCNDTPIEQLEEMEFGIRDAWPLTIPRYIAVRAIITSRLQVHKKITKDWLKLHQVEYDNLILGPWYSPNERTLDNVVEFKAKEYIKCGAKLFIESDDIQAQKIATYANKPVLCWSNQKLYNSPSKKKPVLVFLSEVFRLGGVEKWIIELCEQAKDTWDCVIAVPHPINCEGLMVQVAQKFARIITGKHLCQQICTDADLVITWGGIGTRNAILQRTKPLIFVSHLSGPLGKRHTEHWTNVPTIKVGVSKSALDSFSDNGYTPLIIYNGVDPRKLEPIIRKPHDRLTIGYIGRYCETKNYLMAAQVGQELDCDVIYMGPGENAALSKIKKVCDKVRILRPRLNVNEAYQQIDIFIQASPFETGPLTTLEAMYCGTKVVSTPVGIILELQKEYGKLVEEIPLNPTVDDVIEAIYRAQEDNETWQYAQQIIKEHFTIDKTHPRWLELFHDSLT